MGFQWDSCGLPMGKQMGFIWGRSGAPGAPHRAARSPQTPTPAPWCTQLKGQRGGPMGTLAPCPPPAQLVCHKAIKHFIYSLLYFLPLPAQHWFIFYWHLCCAESNVITRGIYMLFRKSGVHFFCIIIIRWGIFKAPQERKIEPNSTASSPPVFMPLPNEVSIENCSVCSQRRVIFSPCLITSRCLLSSSSLRVLCHRSWHFGAVTAVPKSLPCASPYRGASPRASVSPKKVPRGVGAAGCRGRVCVPPRLSSCRPQQRRRPRRGDTDGL